MAKPTDVDVIELSNDREVSNGNLSVGSSKVGCACLASPSVHLPIGEHQDWFDAILSDRSEDILQCINNAKSKNVLTQGHFHYGDGVLARKARRGPCSSVQLPLAVAAVAGATNSILTLLHAGVSPQQLDCHGNNVLHSLVAFLHYNRQLETQILSKLQLLRDTVSADVMRQILHHENALGLRPLEFAAQHGQGSMVLAILNTPGVYLMKQQVVGLTSYKCYNITEYESTGSQSRAHKSPLLLMTYADEDCVESLCDFVQHDLIKTWYWKKFLLSLPLISFWALVRIAFVAVYFLYDSDMSVELESALNGTSCIPPDALIMSFQVRLLITIYLCLQAGVSLILSFVVLAQQFSAKGKPLLKNLSGYKYCEVQTTLYEGCNNLLCVIILLTAPLIFFEESVSVDIQSYIRVICPFIAIWSCLYFVQILPGIGYFITSIYRMMRSLFLLLLVYFIMLVPFTQTFYHFMNSSSLQGCIKGFEDHGAIIYSLFQMMLNMISLTQYSIADSDLLYITHLSYVFLVAIMLINFFIAVMTECYSQGAGRKAMAVTLQRAEVAFSVEMMWRRLLSYYYRYTKARIFDHEDGEIVIIEGSVNLK